VYSHLGVATLTSLIAFGIIIGVDGLTFLVPAVDKSFVTTTEISNRTEMDCDQQTWWYFDRDCLSRRGTPLKAGTVDEVNNAPEQPLIEAQPADTIGTAGPMQQAGVTAPEPETRRPVAKHPTEVKTQRHVQKKVAVRTRRPTNEALNTVRKFGHNLHDNPATAYAADGARRDVVRPTSAQDVYNYYYYYYSIRRESPAASVREGW
jgi:hypothetical protein